MKKRALSVLAIVAATVACSMIVVFAQTSLSSWPFYVEVRTPPGSGGTYDLIVPLEVMDKARQDLADLRLFDNQGHEIPYALRVRKEVAVNSVVAARLFNLVTTGKTASEVSVDLGENPGEHNEVEIEFADTNFRRRVDLQGSDTGQDWRILKSGEIVFSFESQNKTVRSTNISYPASRYRFLRVTVFADELIDKQAPTIVSVKVLMSGRDEGELVNWGVPVPPIQLIRNQGVPTSAWNIDLGARVPCDRVVLGVNDESFSRPFELEAVDDPQGPRLIASGELTRRVGEASHPIVIKFDKEEQTRKLRLLVTDDSNQNLSISSIMPGAPARQIIFALKDPLNQPLHLYFGNPKALAPHYDFEKNLPAKLTTKPVGSDVGAPVNNTEYRPEPKPLTERIPWLIYVVLGVSSIALALILISLARTTLRAEPQMPEETESNAGVG